MKLDDMMNDMPELLRVLSFFSESFLPMPFMKSHVPTLLLPNLLLLLPEGYLIFSIRICTM